MNKIKRLKLYLKILFIIIILNIHTDIYSQNKFTKDIFKGFMVSASLTYISSASILLNPNSSDIVEKNSTVDLT
ncbi:MAG: hypothetical protein NTU73_08080, partial [Ignavibacteriae bacterium]|nr:hypothetical protein [Ignavibacteriota bacterium]